MSSNHCNHCVPESGHIPRMILALPWIKSDIIIIMIIIIINNNNSTVFVRLFNTNLYHLQY